MNTNDFEDIKKEIKTTFFSRYFSSKRLLRLHKLSLLALTTASTSLITTSLILKYMSCSLIKSNGYELSQIMGSILILIISIIITFADYPLKSERMRNSADKLSKIHKKLRLITFSSDTEKEIKVLYNEYMDAVAGENHSQWDYINGRRDRKLQEGSKDTHIGCFKLAWNFKVEASLILIVAVSISTIIWAATVCLC
ncbi:SLATT domain-containing protein [Alishewanella sp. d11]|uniref:SLATT domain-containing protein n=1 Tax=Alishewanella sp. d11 TaxID=3414030 RepID=UPI003BF8AE07